MYVLYIDFIKLYDIEKIKKFKKNVNMETLIKIMQ